MEVESEQCSGPGFRGGPVLRAALGRRWINWKYGTRILRFPHDEEFLRKLSAIWACPLKNICHPCPRPKILKEVGVKAREFKSLPGSPTCLRPALVVVKVLVVINQNERSSCC